MSETLEPTPRPREQRDADDPHAGLPIQVAGAPLAEARAAVVMVHGRGASAEGILALSRELDSDEVAFLAPQAAGGTWYPYGFMSPIAANEPGISSAMRSINRVLDAITSAGIPHERTFLLGFSQGACLATEFVARNARRYGGLAALSGGLIGPNETSRDYPGTLGGTPAFLGCSDVDGHIPAARVRESAAVLRRLGGEVTLRLYPGMGHLVNGDEIETVRTMLAGALRGE
jgi:predicted esterase